ncbi:MAG: hypothetical protein ACRED4_07670 [Brevundimonas sp.]
MPRDHARIKTARAHDLDWRDLTQEAQWTYDAIVTQEGLSHAGVIDYRPGRIAALAKNGTVRKVETAVKTLEDARFVVVDRLTEELLVRSFVRHDGVFDRANMGKAVGRAFAKVVSTTVRQALIAEMARHYRDNPGLAGWHGMRDLYPDVMAQVEAMASTVPFPMASREA